MKQIKINEIVIVDFECRINNNKNKSKKTSVPSVLCMCLSKRLLMDQILHS